MSRVERSLAPVAAALVMLPLPLPAPIAAAALAVTFAWLPGALAVESMRAPADPGERTLASFALSPALAGGAATVLLSLHVNAALACRFLAALLFIGAVTRALWPRDLREPSSLATQVVRPATEYGPALLWTAIVLAFLIGNPFLPPRSDGWFHAAVTQQIAARGLPVEDPSFAGLRLLSFWVTDVWAALWIARGPGLSVWIPLIALNLVGAFTAILSVCALARRLGAGRAGQWNAAAVAVLGYSPFAWGWVAARAAAGEVRGMDELRRLCGSGVETALNALARGQLHASLAAFADKFLVLTPFGLGLALFALLVMALRDAADQPGTGRLIAVALSAAATPLTHTAVGVSAVAFVGVWWLVSFARGGSSRGRLAAIGVALGAGSAIAAPFLVGVARGRQEPAVLGVTVLAVGSLLLGGALLVPFGSWGAFRQRNSVPLAGDLMVAMIVLTAVGVFVQLPGGNQSKLFNQLFLIAAPPAGLAIAALISRSPPALRVGIPILLGAATIPTALLAGWGFVSEHGQTLESWRAPSAEVAAGWRWVRTSTPVDCVVADEGGAREPMVLAARSALAPGASFERRGGYSAEDVALRRRASRELSELGPVSAETDSLLRSLHREVIVAVRGPGAPGDRVFSEPDSSASIRSQLPRPRSKPRYVPTHDAGAIAYWRVELARP